MPGPFYFAWAGGVIVEQVTVVTSGVTHGETAQTVALVGDTQGSQIINIASTQQLVVGEYYEVSGPGITAGTRFLFDDTVLSGLPNSLNLTQPTTSGSQSVTFQATQATPIQVLLGTLTSGDDDVVFAGAGGLPAGTYAIFGTGIGETDLPINTVDGLPETTASDVLIISDCYVVYNGAGGGRLAILVATGHSITGVDEFGEPTRITTYTVAEQPVRATSSGQFPLALSGFVDADPFVVTDVPVDATAELTPGLVYNISGNGIELGATFVAPSSGTTLTLDLAATASTEAAILTISGPRTPNAPFDPVAHAVFDEDILSLEIAQSEGDFATLTVTLKNPNIGLLALGRNLWCWLSWDRNWVPGGVGPLDLVPLFNGRLIGVPKLAAGEVITIEFLARPDDLHTQKAALSDSLKVLPYYDPIWFSSATTADTVLETYAALWHTNRTGLTLTTSDILEGEDGLITLGEDSLIYDSFSMSYGQPPLVATTVSGTVTWQQQAEGVFDVTPMIVKAFFDTGSAYPRPFAKDAWGNGGAGLIQCLCGDGLFDDWPKPGATIGGGWSFSTRNDQLGAPLCSIVEASANNKGGGWIDSATFDVTFSGQLPAEDDEAATEDIRAVSLVTGPVGEFTAAFPLNVYKIRVNLEYRADRKRTETVTAVVAAGVQGELSDSAESDRETISLTSQYVDVGVDPDGAVPIGDLAYRSYFQTSRGASSLEYLLLVARAKTRARARAVDVTFGVDWRTAVPIGLRHSVRLLDRRLPGGEATGKVKEYRLTAGPDGMRGEFTIGCTIGTGDAVPAQDGTLSYVDDGYVDPGWQVTSGAQIELVTGDMAYQTLDDFVISDDGLDLTNLTKETAINQVTVVNGLVTQMSALDDLEGSMAPADGDPITTMQKFTTTVTLDMKPVQGTEFHTLFFPAVTQLALPKTIDLAAPGA